MRIGVDIDGVLNNYEQFQLDYGCKYCLEINKYKIKNPCGYNAIDVFDWDQETEKQFWWKYLDLLIDDEEPRLFAKDIIKKLKQEGHEIYIITARNQKFLKSGQMEDKTINWLLKNGIHYDNITFDCQDKLNYCVNNNIDIMIEDSKEHILNISTKIPVLCFNAKYNLDINNKNIIRVYSWYDIYQKINEIS